MTENKCPKCGGSGLLPFVKKDGTISKHAKVFCECHDEFANPYPYALKPEDFDFPVSYSVYRSLCLEHGWPDPGADYPSEPAEPQEQVIVHRHSNMSKVDYDTLQQATGELKYLREKVEELTKPKQKQKPEQKYSYKGIE